jgi:2-iminobutanoate/2-iminopropanoate deaminase
MRKQISTDRAPEAIGPYVQGVRAGQLLFTSGQIPIDPKTGNLVPAISANRCIR